MVTKIPKYTLSLKTIFSNMLLLPLTKQTFRLWNIFFLYRKQRGWTLPLTVSDSPSRICCVQKFEANQETSRNLIRLNVTIVDLIATNVCTLETIISIVFCFGQIRLLQSTPPKSKLLFYLDLLSSYVFIVKSDSQKFIYSIEHIFKRKTPLL